MSPSDLTARLDALARTLPAELRRAAVATALDAEAEAKQNATTTLNVRTGRLRASIAGTVEGEGGNISIVLRAGTADGRVPYARIHEEGGTIRPKSGRFLKIPVGPALTGAGVARGGGKSGLHFIARGAGGLLADAEGRIWFVLKPSVRIPARPYLRPALDAVQPRLIDRLQRIIVDGVTA